MRISVVEPVGAAMRETQRILFRPFKLEKWLVLGFCAFLAYLGEGGGGGGSGGVRWDAHRGFRVQQALEWVLANLWWITICVGIGFTLLLVIGALVTWLRSRGKFMFLDGVARNEAAVVRPWTEFASQGNSLFVVAFLLGLISFSFVIGTLALGGVIAWPDLRADRFSGAAFLALGVVVTLMLVIGIVFGVIGIVLEDFIVPTMYLRRESVLPAWRRVQSELLAGHEGTFVLYCLMKLLIAIVLGLLMFLAACVTCCIAALPYIGTVILLPLFVFKRCFALCFLEQYGPGWRFFVGEPPPASASAAGLTPS